MRYAALTVLAKEVIDNFRDRRTLMSALVFGPLFGPLMFTFMINMMLTRAVEKVDEPLSLPVVGAQYALNLLTFLEQNNIDVQPPPDDPQQAVRDGEVTVVLIIPPDYPEQFSSGLPARLELVADSSDRDGSRDADRARAVLNAWSQNIARMRMLARGVNPIALQPVSVESVDVATPAGRSVLVLGMMTYFILFATLVGGMYLATDTTAGERERRSLEPLLTLPVSRSSLIAGKIGATMVYTLGSLAITLIAFTLSLRFISLQKLGMSVNFGPETALSVFGLMLPFALLSAALLTVVASFTRSYKEAQTYLSVVLLVPTLPIAIAAVQGLRPDLWMMLVPSLGQHLLITELIKGEPIQGANIALSMISTLLFGLLLGWLAARLYRREAILG